MARPKLGDSETERLHVKITADEVASIEDWRYDNRVPSRSEAVRRLVQIGLVFHRDGWALLKRTERSLKATLLALDRVDKADLAKTPKPIRAGLLVSLNEQIAANQAILVAVVAAGVYADGRDDSEIEDLIKRAEGYVEILVNKEPKK